MNPAASISVAKEHHCFCPHTKLPCDKVGKGPNRGLSYQVPLSSLPGQPCNIQGFCYLLQHIATGLEGQGQSAQQLPLSQVQPSLPLTSQSSTSMGRRGYRALIGWLW